MVQRAAVDRHRGGDGPPPGSDHQPADRPRPLTRPRTGPPTSSGPSSDAPRERWNERYRERGLRAFARSPSPWLAEQRALVTELAGRRALDVACGDGRNAGYLASELGFEVDAVDVSDVAIDALRTAAAARGLAVHAQRVDLEQDGLPAGPYHLIVQINYLQRDLFGALARALAPGGLLILETFTRPDLEALGNRVEAPYLLDAGELSRAFPDLEVVRHREAIVEHGGRPRAVAGLVARRG